MLLLDEPAVVRRPAGVVLVTGPERLGYLHTLLSQSFEDAGPGACADFLYLDAKGNALAEGRAVVHAAAVLLVVAPALAGELAAALERYKFLTDVRAEDASATWALASVRGPGAEVPGARDEPMTAVPRNDGDVDPLLGTSGLLIRDRSGGVDLLGTPAWVDARLHGLGLPEASAGDWDAWRILHGRVAWGRDLGPGRRPQELGLLPTHVHLRKGCYPGQESIAKTYNLGRPRRALTVVRFTGPVADGARVEVDGGSGEVTSAAATDDGTVALALLPVDRATGQVAADGAVRADGVDGVVLSRVGAGLPQPGA